MELNETNRMTMYRALPPVIKGVYASDEIATIIKNFGTKRTLIIDVPVAVRIVGDCVLGFYRTTALSSHFQNQLGMSADDSQRLTSELLELLTPITAKEEEDVDINREELQKLADTFAKANREREAAPAAAAPAIVESVNPEDIKPLRTMESDMNRIHGYGAYREQNPLNDEPVVSSSQDDALSPPPPSTAPVEAVAPEAPAVAEAPEPIGTTPEAPIAAATPAPTSAAPVEADGSVRIPINSPLKQPDELPPQNQ